MVKKKKEIEKKPRKKVVKKEEKYPRNKVNEKYYYSASRPLFITRYILPYLLNKSTKKDYSINTII